MGLEERVAKEQQLIALVDEMLWQQDPLRERFMVVPFGQETHISRDASQFLRFERTITSHYIRYAPDFFLIDKNNTATVHMLEYKTSLTPRYARSGIMGAAQELGNIALSASDLGNWEEAAYDNYARLAKAGIRVAVIYYCAYHPRLLMCDYVEALRGNVSRFKPLLGSRGSMTPSLNFNTNDLRTLEAFMADEHGIDTATIARLCSRLRSALASAMPVEYAR
jgi:hypothetical protein